MKPNKILGSVGQFIDWLQWKIRLNYSDKKVYPRKKEIWWVSLGYNIGVEINGKNDRFERPVLVIKAFNADSFLVAPISSRIKDNQYLYRFTNEDGLVNVVVLSQLRTLSVKRFLRKAGVMPDYDFDQITSGIVEFLSKTETPQSGVSSELPKG